MEQTPDLSSRVAASVRQRIEDDPDLTVREMSERTGIPLATLSRRLTGVTSFKMSELVRVAHVFDVTVGTLVAEAEPQDAA